MSGETKSEARGTFEVKLAPQPPADAAESDLVGRMSIAKTFQGDLEATSVGAMMATRTPVKGSAGYVAIERVTGVLAGRNGTFVLQHSGIMDRGNGSLTITVVPDSGTGDLAGLRGTMSIEIADGKHSYVFEYVIG